MGGQKETDLLYIEQKRLLVILPFNRKLTGMREFIARQLYSYLKAIRVQVAEVIHACKHREIKLG